MTLFLMSNTVERVFFGIFEIFEKKSETYNLLKFFQKTF